MVFKNAFTSGVGRWAEGPAVLPGPQARSRVLEFLNWEIVLQRPITIDTAHTYLISHTYTLLTHMPHTHTPYHTHYTTPHTDTRNALTTQHTLLSW